MNMQQREPEMCAYCNGTINCNCVPCRDCKEIYDKKEMPLELCPDC